MGSISGGDGIVITFGNGTYPTWITSITHNGFEYSNVTDGGWGLGYEGRYNWGLTPDISEWEGSVGGTVLYHYLSGNQEWLIQKGCHAVPPWGDGLETNRTFYRWTTIGFAGLSRVVEHIFEIVLPVDNKNAIIESPSWCMPSGFGTNWIYDIPADQLISITDFTIYSGQECSTYPIITRHDNGVNAMGTYSPYTKDHFTGGVGVSGYNVLRYDYRNQWIGSNVVATSQSIFSAGYDYPNGNVPAGGYWIITYISFGTLDQVKSDMAALNAYFYGATTPPSGTRFTREGVNISDTIRWRSGTKIADVGFQVGGVDISNYYENINKNTAFTNVSTFGFKKNGADLNTLLGRRGLEIYSY